jgi:phosphonate transport system substrate-binding protein
MTKVCINKRSGGAVSLPRHNFVHAAFFVFVVAAVLGLPAALHAGEPLRFAVTDVTGLEEVQREFGAFQKTLSAATGIDIRFFPVNNRTAAVEALKSKRLDLVLTGPAEYIVFRSRTEAYPVAGFSRPDYFAAIFALAENGITSSKDLKGKKIALGDGLDIEAPGAHAAP